MKRISSLLFILALATSCQETAPGDSTGNGYQLPGVGGGNGGGNSANPGNPGNPGTPTPTPTPPTPTPTPTPPGGGTPPGTGPGTGVGTPGSGDLGGTPSGQDCASATWPSTELGLNDPFAGCQWHIKNEGLKIRKTTSSSTAYSSVGTVGADINGVGYAMRNYTGKGVKMHVVDDSSPYQHVDFAANYDQSLSKNCSGTLGGTPTNAGSNNHGIMVAGIIGAVGNNGIGVTGIGHESKVSSFNAISASCQRAISQAPNTTADVWNGSYGMPNSTQHMASYSSSGSMGSTGLGFHNAAIQRGIAFHKAAGNGRSTYEDMNRDPSNISPYVSIIAALDNEAKVTSYSTPGAGILLASFAGYSYGGSHAKPAIWTVDRNNTYTSAMNGTSAATPVSAGVATLLKEAKPGIDTATTQYALISSARPLSTSLEPTKSSTHYQKRIQVTGEQYINNVTNSMGYFHSFHSGFGIVNADKAVIAAEGLSNLPTLERYSVNKNSSVIPKSSGSAVSVSARGCAEQSVTISDDFQVFSAEISVNLSAPSGVKYAIATYTTPSGTEAQLFRDSNIGGSGYNDTQRFKALAPFAENAKGVWKIKVCHNGSSGTMSFNHARVDLFGFSDITTLARKP